MIAALCASAALLLLGAGIAKIARPAATVAMLASLLAASVPSLPRRPAVLRPVVRLLGVGEVGVAVAVLAVGGAVPAALLALAYLGFAVVSLRLATGPVPVSCGCFGRDDAPVTLAHVAVTLLAAGVAVVAVVHPVPTAGGLYDDGVVPALAGSVLVALLAWVAYLSVTALPALSSARRLLESP